MIIVSFLNKYNHNDNRTCVRTLKERCWKQPLGKLFQNRCSSNSILNFDNKLMTFCKFLEDISKEVRFYEVAALQPIYLLKRAFLLKKTLMVMLKF